MKLGIHAGPQDLTMDELKRLWKTGDDNGFHKRANGIVVETNDPGEDYKLTIGSPINVREETKKAPHRAPEIGADSLSVLRDMQFDETYIQELLSAGVIFSPPQAQQDAPPADPPAN